MGQSCCHSQAPTRAQRCKEGKPNQSAWVCLRTCGCAREGQQPLFRLRWSHMATAGLCLLPPCSATLLPPADILGARGSCQGQACDGRHRRWKGQEGAGGEQCQERVGPTHGRPGKPHTRAWTMHTCSSLGRLLRGQAQEAGGGGESGPGSLRCPPGSSGPVASPSPGKSHSLSSAQHVCSARHLKPRLF